MLYFLGEIFSSMAWAKSIYLRVFIGFLLAFATVLFTGKPFIKYLKGKKLGESIRVHGSALESLGKDWEEFITVFDGECEIIEMDYFPKFHYEQGMKLIKKMKKFLAPKFPELFDDK